MAVENRNIFLVGDSTCCNYTENHFPREGWGMKLQQLCRDGVTVHNRAASGNSTKRFEYNGFWQKVLDDLKPGDFVVIQMGHNDKHPVEIYPELHTDLGGEFEGNLRRWIGEVRSKNGIPLIVTTTVAWAIDGLDKKAPLLAEYNRAALEVSRECGVESLDLNTFSFERFSRMPLKEIHQYYMASTGIPRYVDDYCHLRREGAELYAGWFVELCKLNNVSIAGCFK